MKRRRAPTRVILKSAAVWELLDQLDLSRNDLARRCGITSRDTFQRDRRPTDASTVRVRAFTVPVRKRVKHVWTYWGANLGQLKPVRRGLQRSIGWGGGDAKSIRFRLRHGLNRGMA